MTQTDNNVPIDEHIKERLLKYAPEDIRSDIERLITSGHATVHDFIDHEELLFLPKEELEKKIQTLSDQLPDETSEFTAMQEQLKELDTTIESTRADLATTQDILNKLSN